MELVAWAESVLYWVSSLLRFPVIVGLVFLLFYLLMYSGRLIREAIDRRRGRFRAIARFQACIEQERGRLNGGRQAGFDIDLERLLARTEMAMFKSVDKIKFAVRAGPALGLMGTLIPMGIALASLAQGSVPQMAEEMVTAFTATVVGLGCGVVAYRFSLIKEHWANSDLREMEYLAEAALREAGTSGAASSSSGTTPSGKVFEGVD